MSSRKTEAGEGDGAPRRHQEIKGDGEDGAREQGTGDTPGLPKARRTEEIADIAWELRALSKSAGADPSRPPTFLTIYGKPIDLFLADLADRIEAAAARERGKTVAQNATASGNAAALREALQHIEKLTREFNVGNYSRPDYTQWVLDSVRFAIAAPARNCDRFATAGEAMDAFFEEEAPADGETLFAQFVNWLFAKAKRSAE